jgi:hypothetical protein
VSILRKSDRKASAREQINIKGVQDGVLMLPRHEYRLVLEVSSVNFELKSEAEQDALIDTYESFLNSLPCAVQIIVRLREMDMSGYLTDLQQRRINEQEPAYQNQIDAYSEFVQSLVADNRILSRHFYAVLPYTADDFATAREQLLGNADLVAKGFMRLGMRTRQLESLELLDLFHSFYNPAQAKAQPITDRVVQLLNNEYVRSAT